MHYVIKVSNIEVASLNWDRHFLKHGIALKPTEINTIGKGSTCFDLKKSTIMLQVCGWLLDILRKK